VRRACAACAKLQFVGNISCRLLPVIRSRRVPSQCLQWHMVRVLTSQAELSVYRLLLRNSQLMNNTTAQNQESVCQSTDSESSDQITRPFLCRIEKLVLTLLGARFVSQQALWQFQLDLLHLQRDIQSAITDY
jgi:hypothetical protein